jgi:GNAT superfamily N-acetyltransferase
MKITIRPATENDCEAVATLLQEAARWLVTRGMSMWNVDAFTPEKIGKEILDFHVARCSEDIAAVLKFQLEDSMFWPDLPSGDSAFVHRLAVRRKFAGRGLPRALLDFAAQKTRALGKAYLRLDCAADRSKLRRMYEEYGFRYHSDFRVPPFHVARYEYSIKQEPNQALEPTA